MNHGAYLAHVVYKHKSRFCIFILLFIGLARGISWLKTDDIKKTSSSHSALNNIHDAEYTFLYFLFISYSDYPYNMSRDVFDKKIQYRASYALAQNSSSFTGAEESLDCIGSLIRHPGRTSTWA